MTTTIHHTNDTVPGTITRQRTFAQIPDALIIDNRLSSHAVRLWARLDKYAGANGAAFPSRTTLADDLNWSLIMVARALRELTTTGWITRTRRGTTNIIDTTLHDQPNTQPPANITTDTPPVSPPIRPKKDMFLKETPIAPTPRHSRGNRPRRFRKTPPTPTPQPITQVLNTIRTGIPAPQHIIDHMRQNIRPPYTHPLTT